VGSHRGESISNGIVGGRPLEMGEPAIMEGCWLPLMMMRPEGDTGCCGHRLTVPIFKVKCEIVGNCVLDGLS
jgi:hypothetical protein